MISTPTQGILNRLYYGDCLRVMQQLNAQSVDLIYLDPPFKSDRDYNSIYKDETGRPLPDQVRAFTNTWEYTSATEKAIRNTTIKMLTGGIDEKQVKMWEHFTKGLKAFDDEMLAYVVYMAERILEMKRLLKDTGSIYLHCAPSASHYLKILMDIIFGEKNFINELIWSYRTGGTSKRYFRRKHDIIFLFSKKSKYVFNQLFEKSYTKSKTRRPGIINYGAGNAEFFEDENGVYNWVNMRDVWDISYLNSQSSERLGYATQKPLTLLERIISASSNEGDVVLDPFCGCATTIEAAHMLKRNWLGIDIAIHAINRVSRDRLKNRLNLDNEKDYLIEGIPMSFEGAADLWKQDHFEFQKWAVEEVDGFMTNRKTSDGGIDGRIYFAEPNVKDLQSMILEVKGGKNVNVNILRDLSGTLNRDDAKMAGLILLHELSDRKRRNFEKEIAANGFIEIEGKTYPRIQFLTIAEILDGRTFDLPSYARGRSSTAQDQLPL